MVIADVRFKVALRLRAFLERWQGYVNRLPEFRVEIERAQSDPEAARSLQNRFMDSLRKQFPGCTVSVSLEVVWIFLPSRYRNAQIPVIRLLPHELRNVAHPKGFSNTPF